MNTRVGYISLVGRPNAGKSTLLNAIVGQKIAGVSAKPQTTRNKILGIANHNESQLLFLDTPGMHRLSKSITINSLMNREAFSVIQQSDLVFFLIDTLVGFTPKDKNFLEGVLKEADVPVAVLLTKSDKCNKTRRKEVLAAVRPEVAQLDDPNKVLIAEPIFVSAKQKDSLAPLLDMISPHMPEGEWIYTDDEMTDRPTRFIASELIREKVFRTLGDEIPYQTAVRIDEMSFEPNIVNIMASVIVARDSQKGMVIGKRGNKIKDIGIASRTELETLLGQKVFLDLQVKVDGGWFNDRNLIAEYSALGEGL